MFNIFITTPVTENIVFICNLTLEIFQMDIDEKNAKGEGFKPYYITKIEELQLIVAEKSQNLRRLQAQRNELNAKGDYFASVIQISLLYKAMKA